MTDERADAGKVIGLARLEAFLGRHYGRTMFYMSASIGAAVAYIGFPAAGLIAFAIGFLALADHVDGTGKDGGSKP